MHLVNSYHNTCWKPSIALHLAPQWYWYTSYNNSALLHKSETDFFQKREREEQVQDAIFLKNGKKNQLYSDVLSKRFTSGLIILPSQQWAIMTIGKHKFHLPIIKTFYNIYFYVLSFVLFAWNYNIPTFEFTIHLTKQSYKWTEIIKLETHAYTERERKLVPRATRWESVPALENLSDKRILRKASLPWISASFTCPYPPKTPSTDASTPFSYTKTQTHFKHPEFSQEP